MYIIMNAKRQIIRDSQIPMIRKCAKCQCNAEFDIQHQQTLCQQCLQLYNIKQQSVLNSGNFYSQPQHEVKSEIFNSLPLYRKVNSLQNEAQNQFIKKKKGKQLSKTHYSLQVQLDQTSQESDEERLKREEKKLMQKVRQDKLKLKIDKKIVVGSGFTFDMTDFFKFKKKQLGAQQQTFFESISADSRIAWVILLFSICTTAMIPSWTMNIKATNLQRQQWRFFMQIFTILPFALYEKRTISKQLSQRYTFKYIFSPENIIKPYISSLSSSLWALLVLTTYQWTYVSHGIVLGNLSNFFLSIGRSFKKNSHELQSGGQVLVVVGILFVLHDSLSVQKHQISMDQLTYLNTSYLTRTKWERIGADMLALIASFMVSQFSKYTSDMRSYYPPFLSLLLVYCFNAINLTLLGFFFHGATFDFDPFWGIFSLFTTTHFTSFFYMAIVLAFGQLVSVLIITKMFPDPIIPAIAMTMQPFLACLFIDVAQVQNLPGNYAMIGFMMIFPGVMLVLMGQCFFQRQKSQQEESNQKMKKLMEEVKLLKNKQIEREMYVSAKREASNTRKRGSNSPEAPRKVHF